MIWVVLGIQWDLLCFLGVKHYFFKNEQIQKWENVMQIILEKLKLRKLINCVIFKPIKRKYSICFKVRLKYVNTVLSW